MHHWSTIVWQTINVGHDADSVLLMRAPQLGFENDFLLNCLLGISSLHMEYLNPHSAEIRQQTSLYRVRTLSSFRANLATFDLNSENWEASLLTSILLIVLFSKDSNFVDEDLPVIKVSNLFQITF